MASPISPMEALQIVSKAVSLYKKIKGYPDEIKTVGKRIEDLEFYLSELQALINDKRRHSLANLRPQQARRLRTIIKDIQYDASDVYEILRTWESAGSVSKVFFSIGKNPRRLDDLKSSMDQRKQDLRDILQLMGLFALQPQSQPQSQPPARPITPTAPWRTDYGVIFVDAHNLGRSKVAEGYIKLVRQWTVRTGGEWRIKFAHSSGMRVGAKCDCADTLKSLPKPVAVDGGDRAPSETAMASLYDNKYFDYPWKSEERDYILKSRSRGLTKNLFKSYDFILVFTGREYEDLLLLKQAFIKANGSSIAPEGKGRLIHLGAYLDNKKNPGAILDAPRDKDGKEDRAKWNETTSQVKLAVKAFLKTELEWKQPPMKAPQS